MRRRSDTGRSHTQKPQGAAPHLGLYAERTHPMHKGTLLYVVVALASFLAVLGGGFVDGS